MVQISLPLLSYSSRSRGFKKFLDSIRILVKGGMGGNGYPKFGGIGGKGGDVYIQASDDFDLKRTLVQYPDRRVKAEEGQSSKSYRILGGPGKNAYVKVPVGVTVVTDFGQILGDLNKNNDKVQVAFGGEGGCPENDFLGQKGFFQSVTLDLKLIADVGFVGFPNAGKSTLLKALSRAAPKIASYPFTTIEPNIGIMEYDDCRTISLADLPGLIEGAHLNFGMGHRFLKHVIRTKLLMLVVDVHGFQLKPQSPRRSAFETIMLLNKELELYKEDLVSKPALLVLTKSDLKGADKKFDECVDLLKNAENSEIDLPVEFRPKNMLTFDKIVSICARTAQNVGLLKRHIRELLDLNYEIANKSKTHATFISSQLQKTRN